MKRLIVFILSAGTLVAGGLGPATAQRACQFDDPDCIAARAENQRSGTVRRLGNDNGTVRNGGQQDLHREQLRREQLRRNKGAGRSGCDVKPVISGQDTRVVPNC